MSGKFIISRRSNGDFQFSLRAANGQVILASQGYVERSSCKAGIESVKRNSQNPSRYDRRTATSGKYYFNLLSANGQVIGSSEMYESTSGLESGIAAVTANATGASIEERH